MVGSPPVFRLLMPSPDPDVEVDPASVDGVAPALLLLLLPWEELGDEGCSLALRDRFEFSFLSAAAALEASLGEDVDVLAEREVAGEDEDVLESTSRLPRRDLDRPETGLSFVAVPSSLDFVERVSNSISSIGSAVARSCRLTGEGSRVVALLLLPVDVCCCDDTPPPATGRCIPFLRAFPATCVAAAVVVDVVVVALIKEDEAGVEGVRGIVEVEPDTGPEPDWLWVSSGSLLPDSMSVSSLVEMAGDEVAEDMCEGTPAWDCGWDLRYSSSEIKGRLITLLRCISRLRSWSLAEPQRFQEKRRLTLPDSR